MAQVETPEESPKSDSLGSVAALMATAVPALAAIFYPRHTELQRRLAPRLEKLVQDLKKTPIASMINDLETSPGSTYLAPYEFRTKRHVTDKGEPRISSLMGRAYSDVGPSEFFGSPHGLSGPRSYNDYRHWPNKTPSTDFHPQNWVELESEMFPWDESSSLLARDTGAHELGHAWANQMRYEPFGSSRPLEEPELETLRRGSPGRARRLESNAFYSPGEIPGEALAERMAHLAVGSPLEELARQWMEVRKRQMIRPQLGPDEQMLTQRGGG